MSTQGLPLKGPVNRSSSVSLRGRVFTATVDVAGVVPTAAEIATAIQGAYSATEPAPGDVWNLTVGGVQKFRAVLTATSAGPESWRQMPVVVGGVTLHAQVVQTGLY